MKVYFSTIRLLFLITILMLFACGKRIDPNRFKDVKIEEGDLVFRRGTGTKSRAVLNADSLGIYSHVGIIVKLDEKFCVVHITPGERHKGDTVDKVKAESLDEFWSNKRAIHGAVFRFKTPIVCAEASSQAIRLLKKGVQFDHDYELNDSTMMYCTEFVWYAYSKAGVDISSGKRSRINMPVYGGTYLLPSDIFTNPEFKQIFKF